MYAICPKCKRPMPYIGDQGTSRYWFQCRQHRLAFSYKKSDFELIEGGKGLSTYLRPKSADIPIPDSLSDVPF